MNYESLLARAGFVLRLASPGRAFAGQLRLVDSPGQTARDRRLPRSIRLPTGPGSTTTT